MCWDISLITTVIHLQLELHPQVVNDSRQKWGLGSNPDCLLRELWVLMDFIRFSRDFTRVSIDFRSIWMDFATDQWMSVHFYGWQTRPMNCIRLDSAMAKTGVWGSRLNPILASGFPGWWESLWDIHLDDGFLHGSFWVRSFTFDLWKFCSPQAWAIFLSLSSQAVAVSCGQNTHVHCHDLTEWYFFGILIGFTLW
jgi:hypothetical protein